MKKCLLCNKIFNVLSDQIQQHYEICHGVAKNDHFYRLYHLCHISIICFGLDRFLLGSRDKKIHNFLDHQLGGALSFENKPINISRLDGIIIYSISFDEHQRFYNFFHSDDTIESFLNVFRHIFFLCARKFISNVLFHESVIRHVQPKASLNLLILEFGLLTYIPVFYSTNLLEIA